MQKIIIPSVIFLTTQATNVAAKTASMAALDSKGSEVVGIAQTLAYWVLLVVMIIQLIMNGLRGDKEGAIGVLVKFGLIYGSIIAAPWLFNLIGGK